MPHEHSCCTGAGGEYRKQFKHSPDLLGVLLSWNQTLIQLGIWAFALTVIFQLVTLPVEFNASHRAIVKVEEYGLLGSEEVSGGKRC